MAAVLVATAATIHGTNGHPLQTVADLSTALSPTLGAGVTRIVLVLGTGGAAVLASIVVSIAFAWAVAEAVGHPRSLDLSPRRVPLFYGLFIASVAVGATVVLTSHSLVRLSVDVEVVNALFLPLVLGFLAALAFRVLPRPCALGRRRRTALAATIGAVVAIGLLWVGLALGL